MKQNMYGNNKNSFQRFNLTNCQSLIINELCVIYTIQTYYITRLDFRYSTLDALHIKGSVNHFTAKHVTPCLQEW